MTTSVDDPPIERAISQSPNAVRLARLQLSAILERGDRVASAVDALRTAATDEEIATASGELLAVNAIADDEYTRRLDRAKAHLASEVASA